MRYVWFCLIGAHAVTAMIELGKGQWDKAACFLIIAFMLMYVFDRLED